MCQPPRSPAIRRFIVLNQLPDRSRCEKHPLSSINEGPQGVHSTKNRQRGCVPLHSTSLSRYDHDLLICAISAGCLGLAVILLSSGCGERSTSPLGPLLTRLMHTIGVRPPQDAREFKVLREILWAGHGTTRVIRFVCGVESLYEVRRNDGEQKALYIMDIIRIVIYKFLTSRNVETLG